MRKTNGHEGSAVLFSRVDNRFERVERADTVYWNGGQVMLYRVATGRYQDMGQGYCKENWQAWARHHGIDFRESL